VEAAKSAIRLRSRLRARQIRHDVLDHLQQLTTSRRRVRWVTGWAINETDEQAIALLPENVWTAALRQDGDPHEIKGPDGEWISYQVAELTGVRDLTGWPEGMRRIVRRGQALAPRREEADRLREAHRLALPDHRHEHPLPPGASRGARLRAGVVPRRPLP
jgi:hypothetical protein